MSTTIQRLRYYEREYLRAFDFVAEQFYHMEMRRRLNLALHLWGIVEGLELKKGAVVQGAPDQFYVSPGMAIDAYGREIILSAPYVFSDDDLRNNQISTGGIYSVWIAYLREPTIPPAPGYLLCDLKDQYTRWRESFQILIKDPATFPGPDPKKAPDAFAALSDDPQKYPWPIRLGSIHVTSSIGGTLTISKAFPEYRVFVGLRTQHIISPIDAAKPFKILDQNTALQPPTSVGVEANLFAEQNLIVGHDFLVKKDDIVPAPHPVPPAVFPNPTGNVKVASDLFLQGNLYASKANKWLAVGEYLKSFIPEVKTGTQTIVPVPNTNPTPKGTQTITVSTTLPAVSNASLVVALSGVEWISLNNFKNIWSQGVNRTATLKLNVSVVGPPSVNGNNYGFTVQWEIGPNATAIPLLNVQSFTVTYIALFLP